MDFSFTKSDKIRKSRDYSLLKVTGGVFKTRLMVFNYSRSERLRLGIIVTKKVGNSVFRNRVKRWIREVFRTERKRFLNPVDLVMIPRQSKLSYEEVKRDFLYFAEKYNGKSIDNIN